jgi:hypothetical protein
MNEKLCITEEGAGKTAPRFSKQMISILRWRKTPVAFGLLLLAFFLMGSSRLAPQVSALEQRMVLTSGPGDDISVCPTHETKCHIQAVLTYGHTGCLAIDGGGFCTSGKWPLIPGARWIWYSQLTSPLEARDGSSPIVFIKEINLPQAPVAAASITITADNAYEVSLLNGKGQVVKIGSDGRMDTNSTDGSWQTKETWDLAAGLTPGYNLLNIKVINYRGCGSPICNPAGLIYRIDIELFS